MIITIYNRLLFLYNSFQTIIRSSSYQYHSYCKSKVMSYVNDHLHIKGQSLCVFKPFVTRLGTNSLPMFSLDICDWYDYNPFKTVLVLTIWSYCSCKHQDNVAVFWGLSVIADVTKIVEMGVL